MLKCIPIDSNLGRQQLFASSSGVMSSTLSYQLAGLHAGLAKLTLRLSPASSLQPHFRLKSCFTAMPPASAHPPCSIKLSETSDLPCFIRLPGLTSAAAIFCLLNGKQKGGPQQKLGQGPITGQLHAQLGWCRSTQATLFNAVGALYASTLFLGIVNSISVQPTIAAERSVYYREQPAGYYGVFPW